MKLGVEDALQKMCVNWFRLNYRHTKYKLFSVPNGGDIKSVCVRAVLKMTGLLSGAPDLIAVLPNKVLFIEMKKPASKKYNHKTGNWNKVAGGVQYPEQKEFQADVESLGHTYLLLDTFEDFQNNITLWVDKSNNHS